MASLERKGAIALTTAGLLLSGAGLRMGCSSYVGSETLPPISALDNNQNNKASSLATSKNETIEDLSQLFAEPSLVRGWLNVNSDITLEKLRGRIVVVDFWTTFCAPCLEALPRLNNIAKQYGADGVVVLAITYESADTVVQNLKRLRLLDKVDNLIIGVDANKAYEKAGIEAIPVTYLFGRDGKRIKLPQTVLVKEGDLREGIEKLLKEDKSRGINGRLFPLVQKGKASGTANQVENELASTKNSLQEAAFYDFLASMKRELKEGTLSPTKCYQLLCSFYEGSLSGENAKGNEAIRYLATARLASLYLYEHTPSELKKDIVEKLWKRIKEDPSLKVKDAAVDVIYGIFFYEKEEDRIKAGQRLRKLAKKVRNPDLRWNMEWKGEALIKGKGFAFVAPQTQFIKWRDAVLQKLAAGEKGQNKIMSTEAQLIREVLYSNKNRWSRWEDPQKLRSLFKAIREKARNPKEEMLLVSVLSLDVPFLEERVSLSRENKGLIGRFLIHYLGYSKKVYGRIDNGYEYTILEALGMIGVEEVGEKWRGVLKSKLNQFLASKEDAVRLRAYLLKLKIEAVER
ncbi:MAG: TlpA family protein disulfide reductase [Candidatus Dadabacteria bacterium]|nr:MAG: TlpA family protein disulfide reductase [Candidatus Dadabacteria bacterium]